MPGKKQKGAPVSLAEALAATRSAHRRVLALAARLEATERTILAAMGSSHTPASVAPAASGTPAKRPVGRPRKTPAATAPAARPVGRPKGSRTTTAKRPAGRPRG
jgi:outer membrane protein TolC